jgi:hypothetical protein
MIVERQSRGDFSSIDQYKNGNDVKKRNSVDD